LSYDKQAFLGLWRKETPMPDWHDESEKSVNKFFDSSDYKETQGVRWIISALFIVFAFINGFSLSSALLIIAGLLVVPIKAPEYLLSKINSLTALIIAVAIILVGVLVPHDLFDGKKDDFIPGTSNNQTVNNGSGDSSNPGGSSNNSSGSGQNSGDSSNDNENEDDTKEDDDTKEEDDSHNESDDTNKGEPDYILNTDTKKFHYPSCGSIKNMSEKNREEYYGTRQDLIDDGYVPCGKCKP
jgi:hypothetical protein